MLPLLFWFFGITSLISFLANTIAIPIISFIALPASLLGTVFAVLDISYLTKALFLYLITVLV